MSELQKKHKQLKEYHPQYGMYPPCIGGNFMDNQLFLEIRPLRNHQ